MNIKSIGQTVLNGITWPWRAGFQFANVRPSGGQYRRYLDQIEVRDGKIVTVADGASMSQEALPSTPDAACNALLQHVRQTTRVQMNVAECRTQLARARAKLEQSACTKAKPTGAPVEGAEFMESIPQPVAAGL